MKPRQQASRAALDLIERFEGYRRTAARLDDGRWTIGYGHAKTARQGAEVSQDDAEALLIYDLMEVAGAIHDWVYTPLTQNQFDALCCFVFNIGLDNFRHSSVLRRLNEGDLLQAACAMEMWRRVDFEGEPIVLDALVRRRAAEKALFLTPLGGFLPAPSQVLRPQIDRDITGHVPASRPVEVAAPLEGETATAERIGAAPAKSTPSEPPSASQVAADAITARLQSILSDESKAEPAPEPEPEPEPVAHAPEPQPVPEPAPVTSPLPELELPPTPEPPEWTLQPEPLPEAAPPQAEPPIWSEPAIAERAEPEPRLFAADPMTFDDFDSRRVAHQDVEPVDASNDGPADLILGFDPTKFWLVSGGVGLVVFGAGLFLGMKHIGHSAILGIGFGLVGIVSVGVAVYFLLERLGGREEP